LSSLKKMGAVVSSYVFVPPDPCSYNETEPCTVTWLTTESHKKIPCYYLKAKKPGVKTHILYSHGNATDIGQMYEFLVLLRDYLQVNVLHYEYVGYGLAKRKNPNCQPSEKDTYESIEAAYRFLVENQNVSPSDIIVFGTSVGSGPSCHLASKYHDLRGLILECPFSSIMRVVTQSIFARPLDMFVNINKISEVNFPVLILHGTNDDVVPFEHGKALWERIPEQYRYPPQWVNGGTHHNLIELLTVKGYISVLNSFLTHCQNFIEKKSQDMYSELPSNKRSVTSVLKFATSSSNSEL
jgi:pimeloyl-ACP methyl ester carboxylesterase